MKLLADGLGAFKFTWSHLHTVWDWEGLAACDIPPLIHLDRVHAVNFYRLNGIWVKWKQYMTSEDWSTPVLLVPSHAIRGIAAFGPMVTPHVYSHTDQVSKMAWLEQFEANERCATGIPEHTKADLRQLRDTIAGNVSM